MASMRKNLPIGVEFFDELIHQNYYYVDKTMMIADLLHNWAKVNLFTRPRRFGKSLNMSMLQNFFEIDRDKSVFAGLNITKEKELCDEHMGQYPVISISLKGVDGLNFESACKALKSVIEREAIRFSFLADSEKLTEAEKRQYNQLVDINLDEDIMQQGLLNLSLLLTKYYKKKVIILIDEYDVPLDKAFEHGYYEQMVSMLRNIFGNALKTNPALYFAVLTGCLRIAKESIFTGLNNFRVLSILNPQFDEYFGFTDVEVRALLEYYGLSEHYEQMKQWYDGYRFGKNDIYCPWDVINYCNNLCFDSDAVPQDFWSNTSGNTIVRRFIDKANVQTKNEIEQLIAGEEIVKEIRQELTYNELDNTIENLWSVLFTTGYLTQRGNIDHRRYRLAIPNTEIRELFVTQIREWFRDSLRNDRKMLEEFETAIVHGKEEKVQEIFGSYLWHTISIRDTAVAKERKENFYHGILLGLFGFMDNWNVKSNLESGIGYSDILIEAFDCRVGVVIEMKYAEDGNLNAACEAALAQIEEKSYDAKLQEDGMRTILKYGIACFKKDCMVMVKK